MAPSGPPSLVAGAPHRGSQNNRPSRLGVAHVTATGKRIGMVILYARSPALDPIHSRETAR